jgi:hypothetical protein
MADRPGVPLLWTRLHTLFDDPPTKSTASMDDQAHFFKYLRLLSNKMSPDYGNLRARLLTQDLLATDRFSKGGVFV